MLRGSEARAARSSGFAPLPFNRNPSGAVVWRPPRPGRHRRACGGHPTQTLLSPPEGGGGFNVSYPALTPPSLHSCDGWGLSGMGRPSSNNNNHKPTLSLPERVASEKKNQRV